MRFHVFVLSVALATAVFADPRMWDPAGVMIRGEGPAYVAASVSNEDGLTLILWIDHETGKGDIWGQLLDSLGGQLWGPNGRRLVATPVRESDVHAFVWRGCFILSFSRPNQAWNGNDLFLLPIDLNGEPVWMQNNGTGVRVSDQWVNSAEIASLSVGVSSDIALSYYNFDPFHEDYAFAIHRVDSAGNWIWEEPITLLDYGSYAGGISASADADGNFFTAHINTWPPGEEYYEFGFVNSDGEPMWSYLQPYSVDYIPAARLLPVANEGCYVVMTAHSSYPSEIVVQAIDQSGEFVWPTPLIAGSALQRIDEIICTPNIENGTKTGVLVGWRTRYAPPGDSGAIRLQKVNMWGQAEWDTSGVRICGATGYSYPSGLNIQTDFAGGAINMHARRVTENGVTGSALYAARINAMGNQSWTDSCDVRLAGIAEWSSNAVISCGGSYVASTWQTGGDTNTVTSFLFDKQTGAHLPPDSGVVWSSGLNGSVSPLAAVPATGGGAAVVWSDSRKNDNFYYQLINVGGEFALEPHGRPVFRESLEQIYRGYCAFSDSLYGFYLFQEVQTTAPYRVLGVHINANGEHVANDTGRTIATSSPSAGDMLPLGVPDGAGGCYVSWQAASSGTPREIRVQRFDEELNTQWTAPLVISQPNAAVFRKAITATADHGCLVVWAYGTTVMKVSKISSGGSVTWTTTIRDTTGSIGTLGGPTVAQSLSGDYLIAWADDRANLWFDMLYTQVLTQDGERLLPQNGLNMQDTLETLTSAPIVALADSFFFLVLTKRYDSSNSTLYAYKYDREMTPLWPEGGVLLQARSRWIDRPSATIDGNGGLFAAWSRYEESGNNAIFGMYLNADGEPVSDYWEVESPVICDTVGGRGSALVVKGAEQDQFYCFWQDARTSSQIFGQYIDETPTAVDPPQNPVATQFSLSQNFPNPFNATTEIQFALPRAADIVLNVYDVTGRLARTIANGKFPAGEHRVSFDATGLASGVYFYQLRAGDTRLAKKMLLLK